jgi:beta-glucosidase
VFAPGIKLDDRSLLRSIHNVLLAHGKAVQAVRADAKKNPKVGIVFVGLIRVPATDSAEDVDAAREASFPSSPGRDLWANTWWLDPVYLGKYPEDAQTAFGDKMPKAGPEDMAVISQPLDFFGINLYHGECTQAGPDGRPKPVQFPPGHPLTAMPWPITPRAFYWGPRFYHERYGLPIYITEAGMSNRDVVSLDGKVHDPQRIDYLHRNLLELRRASEDGTPVGGFFQWSLMDNFEWAQGYKERFGLVFIDYQTQRRILKDSAHWYRSVIRSNGSMLCESIPPKT